MSQIVQQNPMNIGGGFRAFSLRGGQQAEPIDPFLGADHAWMSKPTFPAHPHAGFSAVSYLFVDSETGVQNRDSLGTQNLINPGGLHWTAAGRGVVHEEVPAVTGKTVHMLQIFVNLTVGQQGEAPFALSLEPEDVPTVKLNGATVRVPLGGFGEAHSPLNPPTKVCLLDIDLEDGAEVLIPVDAGSSAFVMPIEGDLEIDNQEFVSGQPSLPIFVAESVRREIKIRAQHGKAKAVFFSGVPLRQPVYWKGSLAMASEEMLADRVAAYSRGEFGGL